MARGAGWAIGVVFLLARCVLGQTPDPATPSLPEILPPLIAEPAPAELGTAPARDVAFTPQVQVPRFYAGSDFLLWWVRPGPSPALLTTAPNNGLNPNPQFGAPGQPSLILSGGIIGQPGTTALFDQRNMDFHTSPGLRVNAGINLGADGFWAVEASGFFLAERSLHYQIAGQANGTPLLSVPFLDAATGQQTALDVSAQDITGAPLVSGGMAINAFTQLWGYEGNLVAHSIRTGNRRLDLLAGFRTLRLDEGMTIDQSFTPLQAGAITLQYPVAGQGIQNYLPLDVNSLVRVHDSFQTRNMFYGGQLGGRFGWMFGAFEVDLTGKIALGISHERVGIDGFSSGVSGGIPRTTPGGMFALVNNSGEHTQDPFAVVPEIGINLNYAVRPWLRLRTGLNALYWSNVARPGAQIDTVLNSKLIPTGALFPPITTGPGATAPQGAFLPGQEQGRPYFSFHDTAFWAYGVNFGIELRY